MNKIASALAGLAVVAGASLTPAFAQGAFTSNPGSPASFTFSPASFTLTGAPADFFDGMGTFTDGTVDLTSTSTASGPNFSYNTTLNFQPSGGKAFAPETGVALVTFNGTGAARTVTFSNENIQGFGPNGNTLNLSYPTPATAPVPEAGTALSFGALLVLGGVAVLRRKAVKNAA